MPKLSVHAIGRAIDLMVPMEAGDANNGLGDPVANWLVENAEFIGIQRVIWDITSGFSSGVCTARCEGTRIINADCTGGDCAFYGAVCLPGNPPTCGQPAPPEAPEAVVVPGAALPSMAVGGSPGRFNFVVPTRLFDTRTPTASASVICGSGATTGPLTAGGTNVFTVEGLPAGASTVWLNLSAVMPEVAGFLTAFPGGSANPGTSSLNYFPGMARANAVPVVLGAGNQVSINTSTDVEVVADLTGVFAPTGDGLNATPPTRVFDTRATVPIPANGRLRWMSGRRRVRRGCWRRLLRSVAPSRAF